MNADTSLRSPHRLCLYAYAPAHIAELRSKHGLSALIVEQKVREVLKIADRVYVLRMGTVSFAGPAAELQDEKRLKAVYL